MVALESWGLEARFESDIFHQKDLSVLENPIRTARNVQRFSVRKVRLGIYAALAQLVEHAPSKRGVARSCLVCRSKTQNASGATTTSVPFWVLFEGKAKVHALYETRLRTDHPAGTRLYFGDIVV